MNLLRILRQDLGNIIHNPSLIFSNTILPLILIGVMGFVTKGGFGTEPVSSFDYYGVNMMIFSVSMIAITATNAFMEERVKRGNFRIAYAPVSKQEIYLSKILSSYLLSAISIPEVFRSKRLHTEGRNVSNSVSLMAPVNRR